MEQFYSIGMILVMIAIFYFLMIRPENKRKKQAEEMRNSLKRVIRLPRSAALLVRSSW